MRVLLIEDEPLTTKSLKNGLSTRGIICDQASLGQQGIEIAKLYDYGAIILDLMLPDVDGYEVLLRLRAAKVKVPVIILSGLATSDHITKGLNLGADDYITKPFNIDELAARINSVVRRSKSNIQTSLKVSDLVINFDTKIVECGNKNTRLTDKESQVLELLITRRGTVLGKEVFINHIYSPHGKEDKANPKNVDVFICKLRNKLKVLSGHEDENYYIETVWGRGYMFRDTEIKQSSSYYAGNDEDSQSTAAESALNFDVNK
jgi:two-component system cell cycle response regulator CtrA